MRQVLVTHEFCALAVTGVHWGTTTSLVGWLQVMTPGPVLLGVQEDTATVDCGTITQLVVTAPTVWLVQLASGTGCELTVVTSVHSVAVRPFWVVGPEAAHEPFGVHAEVVGLQLVSTKPLVPDAGWAAQLATSVGPETGVLPHVVVV